MPFLIKVGQMRGIAFNIIYEMKSNEEEGNDFPTNQNGPSGARGGPI